MNKPKSPSRRNLVTIEEIEYEDGSTLYDLNWIEEDGTTVSEGLYDEIQVVGKLLFLMRVVKQDPRFLIRKNYEQPPNNL